MHGLANPGQQGSQPGRVKNRLLGTWPPMANGGEFSVYHDAPKELERTGKYGQRPEKQVVNWFSAEGV
jgi:hypothetical protein